MRSLTRHRHADAGIASLVGIVIALLVLGALTAIAVPALTGSSGHKGSGTTDNPTLQGAQSDIAAANAIVCRTNYQTIQTAIDEYKAIHGTPPTSMAELQSDTGDAANANGFTISIDPSQPGVLEVATPGHPAAPGNANCAYG